MPNKNKQSQITLPKSWVAHVKTAILHVVALAQYALTYSRSWPASQSPRFEPRALWPRPAPCALPQVLVKGQPGARIELEVSY